MSVSKKSKLVPGSIKKSCPDRKTLYMKLYGKIAFMKVGTEGLRGCKKSQNSFQKALKTKIKAQ